jgi:hypothetical protein
VRQFKKEKEFPMSKLQVFLVLFCCFALAGCGSSSTSPKDADSTSPKDADSTSPKDFESTSPEEENPCPKLIAGELALSFSKIKTFSFCWQDSPKATYYQLLEDPDGQSGYTQVGEDIKPNIQAVDHIVPLYARVNARYLLKSCNASGCSESASVHISERLSDMTASIGYFKVSNSGATSAYEYFGHSVSLSADGDTLAVGAIGEGSSAKGINGGGDTELNNGAQGAGAVYVFTRTTTGWSQQAYIKASNTGAGDAFGHSVSLSADGDTLAVGAIGEASSAKGINVENAQSNNEAPDSGAVYVFERTGADWSQEAYIKASNTGKGDSFGVSLSISADGDTLAVGAYGEGSATAGNNGNEKSVDEQNSGAVYVFARIETDWSQEAYIKASNTDIGDNFGYSVSLSNDGDILAVGAPNEDGEDGFAFNSGAVYVFARIETDWSHQAYIKASNAGDKGDYFGYSVSLSKYGNILAVGAYGEGSEAKGINGNEKNDDKPNSGAVYVFARIGTDWSQQAYIKASNTDENDYFGRSVSLDADGNTLAVGAIWERSSAKGINGGGDAELNNGALGAGAVYLFTLTASGWSQQAYIKASNAGENDIFGRSVRLDADGNTLAVGAIGEYGRATGINGDQTNNTLLSTGAVYVY